MKVTSDNVPSSTAISIKYALILRAFVDNCLSEHKTISEVNTDRALDLVNEILHIVEEDFELVEYPH